MTGHYPRKSDKIAKWVPWLYLILSAVMIVCGLYYQICYYRNEHKHADHKTITIVKEDTENKEIIVEV